MSKIKQKFDFVDGEFDTDEGELSCVSTEKYMSVYLCFKHNMNITFAQIKLHSSDRYIDAKEVFEDATILGKEICRRWNMMKEREDQRCEKCSAAIWHIFTRGDGSKFRRVISCSYGKIPEDCEETKEEQ